MIFDSDKNRRHVTTNPFHRCAMVEKKSDYIALAMGYGKIQWGTRAAWRRHVRNPP
jgi:hypothetical protein